MLTQAKQDMAKDEFFTGLGIKKPSVIEAMRNQLDHNMGTVVGLCKRPLENISEVVLYPSSARGDMNAYKYVNQGITATKRTFTIIYFIDNLADEKSLPQNGNMKAFVEHLQSQPSIKETDYIFLPHRVVEGIRKILRYDDALYPTNKLVDYDKFDGKVYDEVVRESAQEEFAQTASSEKCLPQVTRLSKDLTEKFANAKFLVILNVNARGNRTIYDAREQRHSSDPTILKTFIETVHSYKKFAVMLTGDKPVDLDTDNFVDATQMWNLDADRHEQRAIMYAVTKCYNATIYIGMQSGVNEDAVLLHNTNVFSICENVGSGQVGLARVSEKMKTLSPKQDFNNFFVVKQSALLTSEGQLAALQLQQNPLATHKLSYPKFKSVIKRLSNQLEILQLEQKDGVIQHFGQHLLEDIGYELQSDSDGESDSEYDVPIRADGQIVETETEVTSKQFKKLKKNDDGTYTSKMNTKYHEIANGKVSKNKDYKPKEVDTSKRWVKPLIKTNELPDFRMRAAGIALSNIMIITDTVVEYDGELKPTTLYELLYDNICLLNEHLTLESGSLSPLTVKPNATILESDRPSETYHEGYALSQHKLMTEKQQEKYLAEKKVAEKKVAEKKAHEDTDYESMTGLWDSDSE
ncbi:MAG: hypothetical protein HWE24_01635 [Oceanospirillaceae bacterium]|nr:hypothetical protein [Oceanospirillaceae bacterium]